MQHAHREHDGLESQRRLKVGRYHIDIRSASLQHASWPVVVLLHGIGVSGEYFLPFATELARTCRVYVLDLPGYGTTPKPQQALNIEELGAVVVDFLDQQRIQGATLIGHSMGCQVALYVAEKTPGYIAGLILLAPTVNERERQVSRQLVRLLQDSCREPLVATLQLIRDYCRFGIRRYLQTLRYMLNDTPEHRAVNCRQPTVVIRGGKDRIVSQEWAQRIVHCLPDARFVEVSDQPHAVHYTQPTATAAACTAFIDQM